MWLKYSTFELLNSLNNISKQIYKDLTIYGKIQKNNANKSAGGRFLVYPQLYLFYEKRGKKMDILRNYRGKYIEIEKKYHNTIISFVFYHLMRDCLE